MRKQQGNLIQTKIHARIFHGSEKFSEEIYFSKFPREVFLIYSFNIFLIYLIFLI